MSDLLIDIRDCQNLNMVASSLVDGSNRKLLLNVSYPAASTSI